MSYLAITRSAGQRILIGENDEIALKAIDISVHGITITIKGLHGNEVKKLDIEDEFYLDFFGSKIKVGVSLHSLKKVKFLFDSEDRSIPIWREELVDSIRNRHGKLVSNTLMKKPNEQTAEETE